MPYDSNGQATVNRQIAVTGQIIQAAQVNVPFEDIQSMLSQVLVKSGVAPMQGPLNMNDFRISNLGLATNDNDAISKASVIDSFGGSLMYATVASAQAATVSNLASFIITLGYYAVGDQGGGTYMRVSSEPTSPAKFLSADGSWWVLVSLSPTLKQCGAKGDGITDDRSKINAALSFYETIIITPGVYVCSGGVATSNRKLTVLLGMGKGACILRFTGSGGLTVNLDGPVLTSDSGVSVRSFTIDTTIDNTATAFLINADATSESQLRSVSVHDMAVMGTTEAASGFLYGYGFNNCRSGVLSKPYFRGNPNTPNVQAAYLQGDCIEFHFDTPQFIDGGAGSKGIGVGGTAEGVSLVDYSIVGFDYGLDWATAVPQAHCFVGLGHFACNYAAIRAANLVYLKVIGSGIIDRGATGFSAFVIGTGCEHFKIRDCDITINDPDDASAAYGVNIFPGVQNGDVGGNTFRNMNTAVFINAGARKIYVGDDNNYEAVSTDIFNGSSEATNVIKPSKRESQGKLLPTGATPSVAGWEGTTLQTQNTGSTTITSFANLRTGQEFYLLINDGFTTIQNNGTNIITSTGANISANAFGKFLHVKEMAGVARVTLQ